MRADSARSWWVIILLGIGLTVSHMDRALLSIAAPGMMHEWHLTGTSLGVLLSAFAWSYALCQIPAGILVDRFGPKRVMIVAVLFWSLASAATGLAGTFLALVGCRLALGLGESPFFAVAHSIVARFFTDRHRGLATAIYTKGTNLGPALGLIVGAALLARFGWHWMFIIAGLASAVFVLPWSVVVPDLRSGETVASAKFNWDDVAPLLRSRALWGASIGYFGFLYLYYVLITWLPTYLSLSRGLTATGVAWMSSVPFAVSLVAGPLAGFVSDRMISRGWSVTGVRKGAIAVGLALEAAVIPAVYATNGYTATALFVTALAGQAISATGMLAIPSAIAPQGRAGFIGSFQQMLGSLGGIASPIITGALWDRTHNFELAIVVAGAMLGVAAVSFLWLLPRVEPIGIGDGIRA